MLNEQIEKAGASDQPELHQLWETVFGDSTDVVQAFYDRFPPDVTGWVLRRNKQICSAAYVIPGNWYISQTGIKPAAYVYAVATEPSVRGNGYAGKLMRTIADYAEERALLLYTRPAEESLFPWYAEKMNAGNTGFLKERKYVRSESFRSLPFSRITPQQYSSVREQILSHSPHLVMSENFLRLQEQYSSGFYAVGKGCCCIVKENDVLRLPELLISDEQRENAVQTILHAFNIHTALVRSTGTKADSSGVAYIGEELPSDTNWGLYLE